MIVAHDGLAEQRHSFGQVWEVLSAGGPTSAVTTTGKLFTSSAVVTGDGRKAIVFKRNNTESARAYECCWGHYYNCNRTRFGMYATALDHVLP